MKKPEGNSSTADWQYLILAVRIIGEIGIVIAVPVVALSYLGRRLDLRFETGPWLTVAGFALAALITFVAVRRMARRYAGEYQNLIDKENQK